VSKKTKKKVAKRTKVTAKQGSAVQRATTLIDDTLKTQEWRVVDVQSLKESLPYIPTGSIVIDYLIGGKQNDHGVAPCPGMPRKRIMQLYGHEGSGKTTLALSVAASAIANGGTVCFIDYENAIVPHYAAALGVPIGDKSKFVLAQPTSLDIGMTIAYAMAREGVDLVVFDSVGVGVPQKVLDSDLKDVAELGQIGLVAAMWSKYLPKLRSVAGKTGTALIGIAQLRTKINTAGGKGATGDTIQGGRTWGHQSDLRLKLTRIQTEKAKAVNPLTNQIQERVIGAVIKAKLEKCRVSAQQGNEETLYIRHGEGFDDYRTLIEIGIAHNLVHKGGAWLEWSSPKGDTNVKTQGMDKFRRQMMAEEGAMQTLYDQVMPYLGSTVTPVVDDDDLVYEGDDGDDDLDELTEMLANVSAPGTAPEPESDTEA